MIPHDPRLCFTCGSHPKHNQQCSGIATTVVDTSLGRQKLRHEPTFVGKSASKDILAVPDCSFVRATLPTFCGKIYLYRKRWRRDLCTLASLQCHLASLLYDDILWAAFVSGFLDQSLLERHGSSRPSIKWNPLKAKVSYIEYICIYI